MPFEKKPLKSNERNEVPWEELFLTTWANQFNMQVAISRIIFDFFPGRVKYRQTWPYLTGRILRIRHLEEAQYVTGALFATKLEYFRSPGLDSIRISRLYILRSWIIA